MSNKSECSGGDGSSHLRGVADQRSLFEKKFCRDTSRWTFHDTDDPVIRYVRDRRLDLAVRRLREHLGRDLCGLRVLVVCGGVGGEATFLRKAGFRDITNSDVAENALRVCEQRDPEIERLCLNAEAMELPDDAYDLVWVQDGLHHLPRPVLGFNEMLRVARRAVVVIEPHAGVSANLLGREWEDQEGTINYVFRWNRLILEQATRSQILKRSATVEAHRLWDHSGAVYKAVKLLGQPALGLMAARAIYGLLTPINFLGNNFVGIVVKHDET